MSKTYSFAAIQAGLVVLNCRSWAGQGSADNETIATVSISAAEALHKELHSAIIAATAIKEISDREYLSALREKAEAAAKSYALAASESLWIFNPATGTMEKKPP